MNTSRSGAADRVLDIGGCGIQCRLCTAGHRRHSHGSHALQGREGQTPVPLQIVQNNLGHVSVGTTSLYLATERDERLKAMRGFWKVPATPDRRGK